VRRLLAAAAVVLALLVGSAAPAAAYEPVRVVHTERVQAGPYTLAVGFSTWPVRALQSLDFTFVPEGGIAGLSGTVTTVGPDGDSREEPLARHPRDLAVWGWDIRALEAEGEYALRFTVDGPQGRGEGELTGLAVLEQPGPPLALSWAISVVPLVGLVAFLVTAWRRTRPVPVGGRARPGGPA
jgi:hypothetical protein